MYIRVSRNFMQLSAFRLCAIYVCTYVHKHVAKIAMDVASASSEFSTGDVEESANDRRQSKGKQGKGLKML